MAIKAGSYERLLTSYFPDATYIASGLDNGKWETDDYKFHLKCGFYTSKTTGRTQFVNGRDGWKNILPQLKEVSEKYKETNLIGKE